MDKKKTIGAIAFLFILISMSALASAPFLDEVAVQYQGSWQWWVNKYEQPTLAKDASGRYIEQEFDLDIDDPNERTVTLNYLGQVYKIETLPSSSGAGWAVFVVSKNGVECGRKSIPLPNTENAVANLATECGLKVWANWEALSGIGFETDVSIEKIWISNDEISRVQNEFFKNRNRAELTELANNIARANEKFRVLEKNNPADFVEGEIFFVHAKTEYFDEEDTSGKTKALVITDSQEIKYVIILPKQWSTKFRAFKPTESIDLASVEKISDLTQLLDSAKMEELPLGEEDIGAFEKAISDYGAAATAAGVGTGATVAMAKGGSTLALYYAGGLATTGTAFAGTVIATGGTIIIVGILAGGTYMALEGTNTHLMVADEGLLRFNYDREYFGFNEGKLNYILLTKDVLAKPVPAGAKTGDVYYRFTPAAMKVLRLKGISTEYADLVNAIRVADGAVTVEVVTAFDGKSAIKFIGLSSRVPYEVEFTFQGFSKLTQTWTFEDGEINE